MIYQALKQRIGRDTTPSGILRIGKTVYAPWIPQAVVLVKGEHVVHSQNNLQ
ncbi:MAG: hypothetical protein HQL84_11915 [Magnetococcales bacterium]|nr:hypothetical protein [Magnetococcales bacterium]MBF0150741.1 hypothetical protein [Magnetococcales bacterium]MBF0631831.1 hypothetical protein [Magnetococcales bacterium]